MATKKKKPARRKKHSKGLSAHGQHRSPKRRKKQGLFDGMTSKANLMESLKNAGLGTLGGAGASFGNKLTTGFKMGTLGKVLFGAGAGFVLSAFGLPKIGVGFAGGMAAIATNESGLHDDDLNDDTPLEDLPVYQTEDGQYVKMLNDGTIEPLNDDELNDMDLEDGNNPYPDYSTMHSF